MSVSTEVQRTLVKSPPELWSELSNPDALARHLSELGEIRITAVEPETKVEWETEGASGVVQLKQSGWGTKVTLSVTRTAATVEEPPSEPDAIAEPADAEAETVPVAPAEPASEATPTAEPASEAAAVDTESNPATDPATNEPVDDIQPEPVQVPETNPEPVATVEPEPEQATEPEPQLGFFARLFRRRRARSNEVLEAPSEPGAVAEAGAVAEPESAPEIELVALAAPEPIYPERPVGMESEVVEPAEDLAAELASVEAQMTAETTVLLTGVLDRLGAAHHRPFSRG